MAGKDLKGIVDNIVDLPTLPQVVTTIMGLLEDPHSSAKDVNDVMTNDPALAGKILKLVNSAFYGLPNPVTSIQQAITILGFNTIKSLAISASVFDLFGEGAEQFSYKGFWTHSVGTATIGHFVARQEPGGRPDTAFVTGLRHGAGKLVLDQFAPVEFQTILETAQQKGVSFAEAEQEVLETSYADIGYWLANKWKLAEEVQIPIQYQNRVEECPEEYVHMTSILAFSIYICRLREYGVNGDCDKPTLPRAAWNNLHLTREDLPALIEQIKEELKNADAFLAVINA